MREREIERERARARASKRASERAREREREREREKASVRARASEQASERERERTRARERECERKRACYPRPISGTARPRAQEHRCRAGAVCSAVVTARFLQGILLSHASHACDHTHTPIHTHTLQTIEATGQIPTPPACSTPLSAIERFFAGAAEQHGKTAAPPANARPSPRVAGRTQPSIHAAGGEKSPPAHGRTDVSPSHVMHSSPLDTPASTRARRLDDGQRPPPHHAQRLRPTRTPHAQQQRAPRHPPTETLQCMA